MNILKLFVPIMSMALASPTIPHKTYSSVPCYIAHAYDVKQPQAVVEPTVRQTIARNATPQREDIKEYSRRRVEEVFGQGQWESFNFIATRESGWNNYAKNPNSTATGICQFLDSTWRGTGIAKTYDAKSQVEACLIYAKNRYGDINNAANFWRQHNYW